MMNIDERNPDYKENSLTLAGAVSLGTSVMIGAGIFALTGQMAEMTGPLFPLAFLAAAIVVGFSSYSYVKLSQSFPSAGGIAMFLKKAYGNGITTVFHALLMYFSMVIAQSFLARTFGAYTAQLFDITESGNLVSYLGAGLLITTFIINLAKNKLIEGITSFLGFIKVAGISVFAIVSISLADSLTAVIPTTPVDFQITGFLGATALGILAFKGFTTITNSGAELKNPNKNVGRAIILSIGICIVVYFLVSYGVSTNLSLEEIIKTKNYSLAAAAKPAFGNFGFIFTIIIAIIATAGGIIASMFAVSRMLAMLTNMKLVPHSHFRMPGSIQKHTLVYTFVIALILTIFFDLTRIASLGIIFYLIMDMAIHWGVLKYLRKEIDAKKYILIIAIFLDLIVLTAFLIRKVSSDPLIIITSIIIMLAIYISESVFLKMGQNQKKGE